MITQGMPESRNPQGEHPDRATARLQASDNGCGQLEGRDIRMVGASNHKRLHRGDSRACKANQSYRQGLLVQGDTGKVALLQSANLSPPCF